MRRTTVWTDGYVGPDGAAGWAFVAEGGVDAQRRGRLEAASSHLAEWVAAERALAWIEATAQAGDEWVLRTDSALVAKGLASRRPAMSGEAAALRAGCRQALARVAATGARVRVERVRREENARADTLARRAAQE